MNSAIARAYVQIVPTAEGIQGKLEEVLGPETESAGRSAGMTLGSTIGSYIKTAIIALGIGDIIKDAILEGADLEQSLGGIETLFKENADMVKQYAQEAYRTAGLSANDYMENVTSFAASLLQGLEGDTAQAAEIANMAMIDMSDNANKMGTDMELIQNAYQGFAKQNFTMLDNLKLGYGGTKEEMERLLADAQELTGVSYDIGNLSEVYQAIHVIQENLGITGTTAAEASETITGSFTAVQAAWKNLLADITLGNDVSADIEALAETVQAAASNILPAIANIIGTAPSVFIEILDTLGPPLIDAGMEMIANIASGLGESLPMLVDNALEVMVTLSSTFIDNIDIIVSAGLTLLLGMVTGILNAIPDLIAAVPIIITTLLTTILSFIPDIIEAGLNIFTSLVEDLPTIISNIVNIIPTLIDAVIGAIVELIPLIINTGVELLSSLVTNIPDILSAILEVVPVIIIALLNAIAELAPMLVTAGFDLLTGLVKLDSEIREALLDSVVAIIDAIINTIITLGQQFPEIGKNLIDGLWNGIKNGWSKLVSSVSDLSRSLVSRIKSTFGIHSPSTVFRDEIGKMLDLGLAEGIEGNVDVVTDAMDELSHIAANAVETDIVMNTMIDDQWRGYDLNTAALDGKDTYMQDMMSAMSNDVSQLSSILQSVNGDIILPIYLGTDLIDERIIKASEIQALRTGGK